MGMCQSCLLRSDVCKLKVCSPIPRKTVIINVEELEKNYYLKQTTKKDNIDDVKT